MGVCMSQPRVQNVNINELYEEEPTTPEDQTNSTVLKLQHIIEAIYDAATKAQTNVQLNNLHNLFWMFPENEQGIHEPRKIPIKVNDQVLDIPVFTLIHHKNLCIHELNIKTKLDINMNDTPFIKNEIKDVKNKKYNMSIISGKSDTTIELNMKLEEPTEAYNRILKNFEMNLGR